MKMHLLFTLFIISYSLSILAQSEYSASINGSLIKDKTNRVAKVNPKMAYIGAPTI